MKHRIRYRMSDSNFENEKIPAGRLPDQYNDYRPSEVEARYAEAARAFVKLTQTAGVSREELVRAYETKVFPLAMQRIDSYALGATCFDVLYMTAGTQPYSQTLSILATPAEKVVFIATEDETCQACVRTAIKNTCLEEGQFEILTFQEPFSTSEFARVLFYHHARNRGKTMAVDITSGRKSMSAALSGFATAMRIPQFYLNAEYLTGYAVNGMRQSIPNMAEVLQVLKNDSEKGE